MDSRANTNADSALHQCRNIPREPSKKVSLIHLVEEIQRALNGKADVVWIQGEPLSGKSQLAAELFLAEPDQSIGLFLETDKFFRTKQFVQLSVAEQISWIVDRKPYNADAISEEDYRKLLYRLQRHARNSCIYWIVDGNISNDDSDLLNSFPINQREFRFVFTCEHAPAHSTEITKRSSKTISTLNISPDEARAYLGDILQDERDIQEIRALCCSSIGRMQKIRSLLQDGVKLEQILDTPPKSIDDLLELEWKRIVNDPVLYKLLAEVAYLSAPVRLKDFCQRNSLPESNIREIVSVAKILSFCVQGTDEIITFSSNVQKKFAARKLKDFEQATRDEAIKRLLGNPEDQFSAKYLASELETAGRHQDLVSYLTPEHFARLLKSERTFRAIRYQANMGRQAAVQLGELGAELGFGVISSVVTGLSATQGTAEQIVALSRLSTPEHALELAVSASTVEERLQLLAKAAASLHRKSIQVSSAIKEQLKTLSNEVDVLTLGETGVDIATDLLAIDSKTAIQFFDRITQSRRKAQEASSEGRLGGSSDSANGISTTSDHLRNGINELPEHLINRFWHEASKYIERKPADAFVISLKKEEARFALFLAKRWLQGNRNNAEAYKVVDAALDLLLADNSMTPQIHDLRELADALPGIEDENQLELLSNRIFTQFRTLGHHGTSAESVRLRMYIFAARYKKHQQDTELNLIDLFIEVQELPDISARATCWAWMLHELPLFADHELLEKNTELTKLVSVELELTINQLLNSAANHFNASKNAITAIARGDARKAFELASRLNTEIARNNGYTALIHSLEPKHELEHSVIVDALRAISTPALRSEAIVDTLMSIRARYCGRRTDGQLITVAPALLSMWREVELASYKFQSAIVSLSCSLESNALAEVDFIKLQINEVWRSSITEGTMVQLGHLAASELADVDTGLAREWMQTAQNLSATSKQAAEGISAALHATLHLCTRLYPSIHANGKALSTEDFFNRFAYLASELPSVQLRLQLWTSLGIRLYFSGDISAAKYISDTYVSPTLDGDFTANEVLFVWLLLDAAPLLYLTHSSSAMARINKLRAENDRDRAKGNIITTILQRTHHRDDYSSNRPNEYTLDTAACNDIVQILKQIKFDSIIYGAVEDFCRSLVSKVNIAKLRRNFVADILKSVEDVVKANLPDSQNIKHEGYLIACEANILRANIEVQPNNSATPWDALYERARAINNVADRVVVTAIVWVKSKCRAGGKIDSWLEDIKADMPAIPSALDRMDRYEWIAKIIEPRESAIARSFLREGLKVSSYVPPTTDVIRNKRQILDFAYAIDAALANELVEKFDTDEASRAMHSKRFKALEMRKDLASKPDEADLSSIPDHRLIELCKENLGSLAAHRINSRPLGEFRQLICRAMNIPVRDALPIWELIVENVVKRNSSGKSATDTCSGVFQALFRAAELSHALIEKTKGSNGFIEYPHGTLGAGERELFLNKMAQWASTQDGADIYISDPYFAPADLDFLRLLSEAAPRSKFRIVTSKETMRGKKIDSPEDGFYDHWKTNYDMAPPATEIAVVGFGQEGKHPIHDRWVITERGGMRLGTSIASLGLTRISELSEIAPSELPAKIHEISTYFLASPPRAFNGERLSVMRFGL